ncbi:MAG: hypothetical protein HYS08_01600 [Chlamydiae bacterium]|nr:hypothetical protein [Chlamydiota bacterium]
MITQVPGLDASGVSIKEILAPVICSPVSRLTGFPVDKADAFTGKQENRQTGEQSLVERQEDTATFKYGDLIYTAQDLKGASKHSLKIILKLTYKDSHFTPTPKHLTQEEKSEVLETGVNKRTLVWGFTDRIDLHSARARRSFANQASERLNLQSAQIEEHLEAMMESLEKQFASCRLPVNRKTGEQENMSSEERNEALTLLKDPNLLERMSQDLDKLGYVGEAINKKILYLVGTSRLLDKPISAIVRSGSGAGKSALIEQVLSLMPQEDVLLFSRITPQSLFYMGREALDRKILAIDERSGSESADYSIRTLQSSGKLSFVAPQKDTRSGEWKTLTREFSARTPYIESSTKEKLNEENLNRCFELYLDESPEQTKRILEAQRKSAAGLDQISEEEKNKLKKLYQNAQKLLDAVEVKVPYELEVAIPHSPPHQSAVEPKGDNERPGSLTSSKFFGVGASWIRTRRDHERFLSLVKVIALVHQYQRKDNSPAPSLKERGEENGVMKRVTATKEDAQIAQALLRPILGELSCDLSKPIQNFYELLKKKVNEEAGAISVADFKFSRRDVRTWLGLPDHIVKRSMKALEELEYVILKRGSNTQRKLYSLCAQ